MSQKDVQPIYIMPEDTKRESGKSAQKNNILAAKLVGETIRTTLGPKGMDKMLVDTLGDIIVTNDGVTILKEMDIQHPAAKMLVEIAKTQENEIGDGTTTAVIIASELLKRAEELLDAKIHPTNIIKGYQIACKKAIEIIDKISQPIDTKNSRLLEKIANTAMTGKGAENSKEILSKIVIDAVRSIADKSDDKININKENIKIEKITGDSVENTKLIKGIVLDKQIIHPQMPKNIKDAKILLLDCPIEVRDNEIDTKIQINDPSKMQEFLSFEENIIKDLVKKITESGADTVFCQKGIDDFAQYLLAKNNISAVRRVKRSDLEKISYATNAKIVNNVKSIEKKDIGSAGKISEIKINYDNIIKIEECKNPRSVTILVHGSTDHVIEEIIRAIEDSIGVISECLKNSKIVSGAGSAEMEISKELKDFAKTLKGREQIALNTFAKSLEIVPRTLAENAGLDPIDIMTELNSAHKKGNKFAGINVFDGKVINALNEGIIEPAKIKTHAIRSATEVAVMILRIDDVIASGVDNNQPPSPDQMM